VAVAVYGLWVRPRLMRWGATDDEATGPHPGAQLLPEGEQAARPVGENLSEHAYAGAGG
jgi:hypothetical protein